MPVPKRNDSEDAQLLRASQAALDLLDNLRICHGVGTLLAPGYRELYRDVTEELRQVLLDRCPECAGEDADVG